jgi:hypothetical protein
MMLKTATSLAFAAARLTAIAAMPVHAQMTGSYASPPGYNGPQRHQGSTSPSWAAPGSYAPEPKQGDMPSSSAGRSGTAVMKNRPQASHSDMSSSWSARQM